MIESGKIRAAYFGVLADHKTPSVRLVADMYRRMYSGIRTDVIRAWMSDPKNCIGTQLGHKRDTARDTASPRKIANLDTERIQTGHLRGGASEIDNIKTPHGVSARERISPVRRDDDFGGLENDVLAVLANDAAERNDGKIATSVLDGLRQRLARARDKHGIAAFAAGLEIALDRGKGAAYAAGCMKRYRPEDAPPSRPRVAEPEPARLWSLEVPV